MTSQAEILVNTGHSHQTERSGPYLTEHLKRFGRYTLDMATPSEPFTLRSLFGDNA